MVQTVEDAQTAVVDLDSRAKVLMETRARRTQAEALLRSLIEAKSECERQLERFRRSDAIQSVTGRSAIDMAIASTRRMIETLDRAMQASPANAAPAGHGTLVVRRA